MDIQNEKQDGSFNVENDYIDMRRSMTSSKSSSDVLDKIEKPLMIMGGLIILGAVAFFVWSPFKNRTDTPDPALEAIKGLEQRLVQLEANIAGINEKIQAPATGGDDIRTRMDKIEASAFQRIDALEQKIDHLSTGLSSAKKQISAAEAKPVEKAEPKVKKAAAVRETKPEPKPAAKKPEIQAKPKATPASTGSVHVVKAGETAYSVSKRYGMTVDELRRANGLGASNTIVPGQKLKVK
jgi:LysM repeat protein